MLIWILTIKSSKVIDIQSGNQSLLRVKKETKKESERKKERLRENEARIIA